MPSEINSKTLRRNFGACLHRVRTSGERMVITRHGTEIAALVPLRDYRALEAVSQGREDFWQERHQRRMEEMRVMREVLSEEE